MKARRRTAIDGAQLGFTFTPPQPARGEAALAGIGRRIAATVALILKEDSRGRDEIAALMSSILDEPVSRLMLDGYASEARDQVNISASRLLALIAVTNRHDLLDARLREIGAALLVGEEIITAELGDIDRQIAALRDRRRSIEGRAPLIGASAKGGRA